MLERLINSNKNVIVESSDNNKFIIIRSHIIIHKCIIK